MRFTRMRMAALIGSCLTVASLGLAAPALAANPSGGGTVNESLSLGETFSFTLNTPAIAFTGSAGGASNVQQVSYNVTTNDAAGATVSVSGTNLTGTAHGGTIPVGDISAWGVAQANASSPNGAPVAGYYPVALSTSLVMTTSFTGIANDANFMDSFAFLGTAGGYVTTGSAPIGSNIPVVAADSYTGTLTYLAVAS